MSRGCWAQWKLFSGWPTSRDSSASTCSLVGRGPEMTAGCFSIITWLYWCTPWNTPLPLQAANCIPATKTDPLHTCSYLSVIVLVAADSTVAAGSGMAAGSRTAAELIDGLPDVLDHFCIVFGCCCCLLPHTCSIQSCTAHEPYCARSRHLHWRVQDEGHFRVCYYTWALQFV